MNIIMADVSLSTILFVPVVRVDTPINRDGDVEELNSTDGHFAIINNQKLMTISWESIFPVGHSYNFIHRRALLNGWQYVDFLNLMKRFRLPIRLIISTERTHRRLWNSLVSIEKFSYHLDEVGDISYSISLKEVPEGFITFIRREAEIIRYVGNLTQRAAREEALRRLGLLR